MMDTPYIAEVADLIGDPARANMLLSLKDDGVLSATELAHVAGVAPNTASGRTLPPDLADLGIDEAKLSPGRFSVRPKVVDIDPFHRNGRWGDICR